MAELSPDKRAERQVSDETAWEMCRHINTQRAECLKCPATKNIPGYGECQQACRGISEDAYWTALSLTAQSAPSHVAPSRPERVDTAELVLEMQRALEGGWTKNPGWQDVVAILNEAITALAFVPSPLARSEAPKGLPPYPLEPVAGCKWPACDCVGRWDCVA